MASLPRAISRQTRNGILAIACCLVFASLHFTTAEEHVFPLVSVVIPTFERPQLLRKALELIGRQSYPNIEVVIVDDSAIAEDVSALSSKFPLVYHHLSERSSIGAKRNLGVTLAKGAIIAHWDDDDYFRPHRLATQIWPLLQGSDMTVLEHDTYLYLDTFTFRKVEGLGPHYGTMVFWKKLFDSGIRYPDVSIGEDYAFVEYAANNGFNSVKILKNDDGKHVYVRQTTNTFATNVAGNIIPRPEWMSEEDATFFAGLAGNGFLNVGSPAPNLFTAPDLSWDLQVDSFSHSRDRKSVV